MEHMIGMIEAYAKNLELMVKSRTEQINEEKKKTDDLLGRMLPKYCMFTSLFAYWRFCIQLTVKRSGISTKEWHCCGAGIVREGHRVLLGHRQLCPDQSRIYTGANSDCIEQLLYSNG